MTSSGRGVVGWRNRPAVRWAGAFVAVALLVAALVLVFDRRESVGAALEAIRDPQPWALVALPACVVANLVLASMMVGLLMSRYGPVGRMEMQALVASAALLNYLPMRAGLLGRVAYHKAVNGIAVRDTAKTVVQSLVITGLVALWFAGAVLVAEQLGIAWWWSTVPIPLLAAAGFAPAHRIWAWAALTRVLDLLVWTGRYMIAFALIGLEISPQAAVAMACTSAFAALVPLASNGLGLREWLIGLLAPVLTAHAMELGITADLVNRAVEVVVIGVAGSAAMGYLGVRRRAATSSIDALSQDESKSP